MSLICYNKSYFVNQPSDLRGLMSVRYFQAGLQMIAYTFCVKEITLVMLKQFVHSDVPDL